MFSNKRKSHWGKIVIITFIFLLLYGYSLGDTIKDFYARDNNIEDEKQNVDIASKDNGNESDKDNEDSSVSTNYPQNILNENDNSDKKISSKTVLVCKTYDSETNNIITNEIAVPSSLINLTLAEAEEYIKSNYRNWVIKEVNEDYIEIYETNSTDIGTSIGEEDSNNNESPYFLLKEQDGIVYIFEYDENNVEQSKKQTNIKFNLMAENDQKLFQKGIKKYSEDELYELLQDFES